MSTPSEVELRSAFDRCLFTSCEELNELDAGLFSADIVHNIQRGWSKERIGWNLNVFYALQMLCLHNRSLNVEFKLIIRDIMFSIELIRSVLIACSFSRGAQRSLYTCITK